MQTKSQARALEDIVASHAGKPGALLGILEEAQENDERRFLSEETLRRVSALTGEPLSRIYSVATFYSFFNLKPQGRHSIVVCRGTACHTRGSLGILQEALARLGAKDFREDEESSFTTEDASSTVRTVACFGQCALAPVVAVDGIINSQMTGARLASIIGKLGKEGSR